MAKLILGIAGEIGSGKGSIAKHMQQEYKGTVHRFSSVLRDILDRIYLEQSRDNIQILSTTLRKKFGEDLLAKVIYHDTQSDQHDIIIVDGVRRMDDILYLRKLSHFKLLYVDADAKSRYERIVKRKENTDDFGKSFEEFKKEEHGEPESQIRDLKNYADYFIDNNGTYQDLYKQIDDIINGMDLNASSDTNQVAEG